MDLSNMSVAQLRDLQEQLKKELTQRETQERAQAIEKILAIAKSVGASVEELMAGVKAPKVEVAPRYRNPADAAQQWTGRGRQPKWVKDWVEAGNDIEGLRIAA